MAVLDYYYSSGVLAVIGDLENAVAARDIHPWEIFVHVKALTQVKGTVLNFNGRSGKIYHYEFPEPLVEMPLPAYLVILGDDLNVVLAGKVCFPSEALALLEDFISSAREALEIK